MGFPAAPVIGDTLAGLLDVNLTGPTNGEVLAFDTATAKWIDQIPSARIAHAIVGCTNFQAIPSGAGFTAISFNVETADTDNFFAPGSPTRLTIPASLGGKLFRVSLNLPWFAWQHSHDLGITGGTAATDALVSDGAKIGKVAAGNQTLAGSTGSLNVASSQAAGGVPVVAALVQLRKNGGAVIGSHNMNADAISLALAPSWDAVLAAGDYVEVILSQSTGGAQNLGAGTQVTISTVA